MVRWGPSHKTFNMRIGVISEGHADRAVISNVITGITGLDISDIVALRPIYLRDATDNALNKAQSLSSYSVIKEECENRQLIDSFLALEDNDFVVIQVDTAEADKFGVLRPDKASKSYSEDLRELVIQKINEWLNQDLSDSILYAIAIEEIDAWVLTIFENRDSSKSVNAKERLNHVLGKIGINSTSNFENFFEITKPLSKKKDITKGKFLSYNSSLYAFYNEVLIKVMPKIDGQLQLFE